MKMVQFLLTTKATGPLPISLLSGFAFEISPSDQVVQHLLYLTIPLHAAVIYVSKLYTSS
jgi:hypothetical protein